MHYICNRTFSFIDLQKVITQEYYKEAASVYLILYSHTFIIYSTCVNKVVFIQFINFNLLHLFCTIPYIDSEFVDYIKKCYV